jgi:uncharacterized protein
VTTPAPAFRDVPEPSTASEPFWTATRERRLVMQRCTACEQVVWYPRHTCPGCGGSDLAWEELAGTGTIHAVSVHHRSPLPALADRTPYAVVLVDLDEGARLMSNVFGAVPEVGARVRVTWEPLADGRHLPLFEPT